ncbi:uncharacterized protein BJX67DRAFT_16593 [Aspergillus lucknowensis]|uniref:Uncharacterized protein n=1 Tax=Aspergillus lucknowensis TaxID=176173 RepID=A0ABR4M837_9EURO
MGWSLDTKALDIAHELCPPKGFRKIAIQQRQAVKGPYTAFAQLSRRPCAQVRSGISPLHTRQAFDSSVYMIQLPTGHDGITRRRRVDEISLMSENLLCEASSEAFGLAEERKLGPRFLQLVIIAQDILAIVQLAIGSPTISLIGRKNAYWG